MISEDTPWISVYIPVIRGYVYVICENIIVINEVTTLISEDIPMNIGCIPVITESVDTSMEVFDMSL